MTNDQPNAASTGQASTPTKVPFDSSMALGSGYDTLACVVRGNAIVQSEKEVMGGGKSVSFFLLSVQDREQLNSLLNISANVSVGDFIEGGSASFGFASSQMIDSYSVYLLVNVNVTNAPVRLSNIELTTQASSFFSTHGPEEFFKAFGDTFIIGSTDGGQYFALLQLHCEHAEDKESLTASMEGGILGTFSASADFASSVDKISDKITTVVDSFQIGGNDPSQPKDIDKIISKAIDFATTVNDGSSKVFEVALMDYNIGILPAGANPVDLENQQFVLQQLSKEKLANQDLLADINYILKNQEEFNLGQSDIDQLNSSKNIVDSNLNIIHAAASACFNDFHTCNIPTNLVTPDVNLPNQKLKPLEVIVPSVIDLIEGVALANLKQAGFSIDPSHVQIHEIPVAISDSRPTALVISQDPLPGSALLPNAPSSIISLTTIYHVDAQGRRIVQVSPIHVF